MNKYMEQIPIKNLTYDEIYNFIVGRDDNETKFGSYEMEIINDNQDTPVFSSGILAFIGGPADITKEPSFSNNPDIKDIYTIKQTLIRHQFIEDLMERYYSGDLGTNQNRKITSDPVGYYQYPNSTNSEERILITSGFDKCYQKNVIHVFLQFEK